MTQQAKLRSFPFSPNSVYADACGNTFVIIDLLLSQLTDWEGFKRKVWEFLPDMRVDDALVLRRVGKTASKMQLKMHVLEPDGTEADFCGNGARAVGFYLQRTYAHLAPQFCLVSRRGEHNFLYNKQGCYVEMGMPLIKETYLFGDYHFVMVDCVEPHLITSDFFDPEVLKQMGKEINPYFPNGVNVNCIRALSSNCLEVLTYERGVHRITAACGTGSCAAVKAALSQGLLTNRPSIIVKVLGGELRIFEFNNTYWLGGPVDIK